MRRTPRSTKCGGWFLTNPSRFCRAIGSRGRSRSGVAEGLPFVAAAAVRARDLIQLRSRRNDGLVGREHEFGAEDTPGRGAAIVRKRRIKAFGGNQFGNEARGLL